MSPINDAHTSLAPLQRDSSVSYWCTAITLGLLGPIAAFAKMGTVPLLIFLLLGMILGGLMAHVRSHMVRSPVFLAFAALMLWCAVSLLWAESPSWMSLIRLSLLGLMALAALTLPQEFPSAQNRHLSFIVLGSTTFLLIALLIEGITDAALHQLIRPEDAAPREGEWVPYLLMVAARGTAMLAPLCFVAAAVISERLKRPAAAVTFVLMSLVCALSLPMDASSLAIVCGGVGFLLTRWKPRIMTRVLFLGVVVVAFLSPFLTSSLINRESFVENGIEPSRSLSQRLEIWECASNLALERPILGHGFDSSRVIGSRGEIVPGTNWPALPLHPHNAFLQVWLELGVVGI